VDGNEGGKILRLWKFQGDHHQWRLRYIKNNWRMWDISVIWV